MSTQETDEIINIDVIKSHDHLLLPLQHTIQNLKFNKY